MGFICCSSSFRMPRFAAKIVTAISLGLVIASTSALPARAEDREVVSKVKATYPEMAKRLRISGTVMLNATVAPNGNVKTVQTVMGEKMLVEAAKEAVLKWKFAPAERETIEDIEIEFH